MLDIQGIFNYRIANFKRLVDFGFAENNGLYTNSYEIMNGDFRMDISIDGGVPSVKVFDCESGGEYVLIHTPGASGAFVGEVVKACEEVLTEICKSCYDFEVFKSSQTKQLAQYALKTYGNPLEFLWKKTPDCAVLRREDNSKWYAVIMTIERAKLGLDGDGTVEIADLKDKPENVREFIKTEGCFPAYHMNKTHWYTICLDGTVSTRELFERLDASRESAGKK